MKAIEQYFPVVLFIMLYKVVLTFESVDEILKCDHSNESYWAVLSCGDVYYAAQGGSSTSVPYCSLLVLILQSGIENTTLFLISMLIRMKSLSRGSEIEQEYDLAFDSQKNVLRAQKNIKLIQESAQAAINIHYSCPSR